jgi:hypothetical protein
VPGRQRLRQAGVSSHPWLCRQGRHRSSIASVHRRVPFTSDDASGCNADNGHRRRPGHRGWTASTILLPFLNADGKRSVPRCGGSRARGPATRFARRAARVSTGTGCRIMRP